MSQFERRISRLEASEEIQAGLLFIGEEDPEAALEAHLRAHPEDKGKDMLILRWAGDGGSPSIPGATLGATKKSCDN